MTLSYPLSVPTVNVPSRIRFRGASAVDENASPFTFEKQVYVHQGEQLSFEAALPPMSEDEAEQWVSFLLALNGKEGTFLMGPPGYTGPFGTWAGQLPVVHGPNQTGRSLAVDGVLGFLAATRGTWIQVGSGSSARLHKVLQNVTFDSGGAGTLDLWPRIVTAPADDAAVTLASPVGCFRLSSNDRDWDIGEAMTFGISFAGRQEI